MNIRFVADPFALIASSLLLCGSLQAQETAFSYQGQLDSGGVPATGSFDMQFSLYDSTGTNLVAGPVTNSATPVTNGVFTVQLDFGAAAFSGPSRFLSLGVRTNGSTNSFTALLPLQEILATPYAITANSASNLLGDVAATQITGALSASQLPSEAVSNNESGITLTGSFNGSFNGGFSGNGSGLTAIPATSLTGSIPTSQLPTGTLVNGETGVSLSGTFSGNGAGLTSVPASGLSGTLSASQLPSSAVVNGESGVSLTGSFSGNGSGLTSVPASSLTGSISSGQLPSGVVFNGQGGVSLSGTFSGNGAGLTGVSAQLPGNVLVNGENAVTLNGAFSGTFSGNGANLNSLNAGSLTGTLPAGIIGPVNASSLQGTLPSSALSGTYSGAVTLNNSGNSFSGNGNGLINLNATALSGVVPLVNLPSDVFTILTSTLTVATNLSVLATQTVATLVVTNGDVFLTNSTFLSTNQGGDEVLIENGNISLSGVLTGNGSGLTNTAGHTYVDTLTLNTVANAAAQAAVQTFGLNETNFTQGVGTTISNYAQSGNSILSNYVAAGTLPKDALITNAMLVGPTTNGGDYWVTNGTLYITNVLAANGVVISTNGGIAASNVTISGIFTGNGTGLTDGAGNPLGTAISNLALTVGASTTNFAYNLGANATNFGLTVIGANATNFAYTIGANATNFAYSIGANDTNFAQTIGTTLTNFASNIGLNDTNFTKSIGVTISNYAQAGSIILSNYVAAGGTLPRGSLLTNVFLMGATTNLGPFWLTNGSLTVSNGGVDLTNAGGFGIALNDGNAGNITFTGIASGNGLGVSNVNAAMLESLTTNNFWLSAGNSGTTPAANFLGTIDQQSFLIKVNLQKALELVPDTSGRQLPTLVGNPAANTVNSSAYGSIIAAGTGNIINSGSYLTAVSGGNGNSVATAAFNSVIAGGNGNTISNGSYESVIAGGLANQIDNLSSNSFEGGGSLNVIQQNTGFATIGGGYDNQIDQGAGYSTIGGGYNNQIFPNSGYSAIVGGQVNFIETGSDHSAIIGGNGNQIAGSSALSVIGGGSANLIGGTSQDSAIVGGQNNLIGQTVASDHGFIGGGSGNSVTGPDGAVVGGSGNTAAEDAFAAGTDAQAIHQGAFVWADSTGGVLPSTNQDTVTFRAQNGYRLYTTSDTTSVSAAGAFLAGGTTAWATISDRNIKKNIVPVDPLAVLEKLARVPVATWNYKWEGDHSVPNIGPMAQDFKHAFYPGRDDKSITTLEFDGVELAAIQGLNTKVEEQDASVKKQISEQAEELKAKDGEIQALKDRLERLEKLLNIDKQ